MSTLEIEPEEIPSDREERFEAIGELVADICAFITGDPTAVKIVVSYSDSSTVRFKIISNNEREVGKILGCRGRTISAVRRVIGSMAHTLKHRLIVEVHDAKRQNEP